MKKWLPVFFVLNCLRENCLNEPKAPGECGIQTLGGRVGCVDGLLATLKRD